LSTKNGKESSSPWLDDNWGSASAIPRPVSRPCICIFILDAEELQHKGVTMTADRYKRGWEKLKQIHGQAGEP
jgi:hypothetical protein